MHLARTLLGIILVFVAPLTLASQISEGVYSQTWISRVAGQCPDCEVRVRRVTPHIVELVANNGWSGFAYYRPNEDRYLGTLESSEPEGGPYRQVLFSIELKFDGHTLTLNASSEPFKFVAVYKKASPAVREVAL